MRVGSSKMAILSSFARYCLPTLHIKGLNYYIVLCSLIVDLIDTEINDLESITLNGYFVLKFVSGSASNWLAFCLSDKTVLKFADPPPKTWEGKKSSKIRRDF